MTTKKFYQLIHRTEVLALTARSKSSLQLDEKNGLFVTPISIGARSVRYILQEVEAVIDARIKSQSPEKIKQLVSELIASRTENQGGI